MLRPFVVHGQPVGKPRMTQRDKWMQRPCVLRYRDWCDLVRDAARIEAPMRLTRHVNLFVVAYLPIPAAWSAANRLALQGKPHTAKPDADNLLKSISDALFENDELIWSATIQKRWADSGGPRVEIEIQ